MNYQSKLTDRLNTKKAVIGIIGLGYVGLPLALRFLEAGFPVIGLDIDPKKTSMLMDGKSYIRHISAEPMVEAVREKRFSATTDFSGSQEADALILCVPTPLDHHREPDLSYVITSLEEILPHLRPGQMISLESTTYPGTTEEEMRPRIEKTGFSVGQDIFLVYSPEREDPGNPDFRTQFIPKICGGSTPACLEVGLAYKTNVDDDRESPTYRIMALLEQKGAKADYNDPYIPEIRPIREYPDYAGRKSSAVTDDYDLIILCTAHDQYREIDPATLDTPILDTRGFFPDIPDKIFRG